MRRMIRVMSAFCFSLLLFTSRLTPLLQGAESLDKEKMLLEAGLTERLESALTKILGADNFLVVVTVQPVESSAPPSAPTASSPAARTLPETEKRTLLPGVPQRLIPGTRRLGEPTLQPVSAAELERLKPFIKSISATLLIDSKIPANFLEEARGIATEILSLDVARGDALSVRQLDLFKPPEAKAAALAAPPINVTVNNRPPAEKGVAGFFQRPDFIWIALAGLLIFLLTVFLFGPVRAFFNRLIGILPTLRADAAGAAAIFNARAADAFGGAAIPASAPLSLEHKGAEGEKPAPFSFINEGNVANLVYLFQNEDPERIAMVVSYLSPALGSRVISDLPAAVQSQVALHLSTPKQLVAEEVRETESQIQQSIDYLIGGKERFLAIFDKADKKTRDMILLTLGRANPALAADLRRSVFEFEDMALLDPTSLRAVFREITLPSLAIALKGMGEELRKKVLGTLPEGTALMLQQEMDMNPMVSPMRCEEEQRRIIEAVRRLEKDGRIVVNREEASPARPRRAARPRPAPAGE